MRPGPFVLPGIPGVHFARSDHGTNFPVLLAPTRPVAEGVVDDSRGNLVGVEDDLCDVGRGEGLEPDPSLGLGTSLDLQAGLPSATPSLEKDVGSRSYSLALRPMLEFLELAPKIILLPGAHSHYRRDTVAWCSCQLEVHCHASSLRLYVNIAQILNVDPTLSIILFAVLTIALRLNFTFNYETGGGTVFDAGVDYMGEFKWLIMLDAFFFILFLIAIAF